MADAALMSAFARDVALLWLVGMKPIIVHGGGWRVDELLRQMGIESGRARRRGGTAGRPLKVVEMALAELNQELAGLINKHGAKAGGLDGQDGRFIHAHRMTLAADEGEEAVDLGYVGDVESVDVDLIQFLLGRGFVPVIMPIGVGADGTTYHINSDLLAGRLARALEAEKLILMTHAPGVLDRAGRLAYILTASEAEALLTDGTIAAGMRPRVTAALQAVRDGVRSVHIIDGGVPSALLLEVLTAQGVGTAVRSDVGPHFLEDSRGYLLSEQAASG